MQIRQGDVYLESVSFFPRKRGAAVPLGNQTIILAWGESTGHKHQLDGGAVLHEVPEGRFLEVLDTATAIVRARFVERLHRDEIRIHDIDGTIIRMQAQSLVEIEAAIKSAALLTYRGSLLRHEEHDAIIVPPGIYRLPSQREYTGMRIAPAYVSD